MLVLRERQESSARAVHLSDLEGSNRVSDDGTVTYYSDRRTTPTANSFVAQNQVSFDWMAVLIFELGAINLNRWFWIFYSHSGRQTCDGANIDACTEQHVFTCGRTKSPSDGALCAPKSCGQGWGRSPNGRRPAQRAGDYALSWSKDTRARHARLWGGHGNRKRVADRTFGHKQTGSDVSPVRTQTSSWLCQNGW